MVDIIWLAYAPPGVWSSGPAVAYDLKSTAEWREIGYRIEGPYVLAVEKP